MSNFLILAFFAALAIGNHPSDGGAVTDFQPEFAENLENLTVPLGRDATFKCAVRSLGGYRVGWVRADSKAIQAIHTHVITHNPRVFVSHSDHTLWHLTIKGVKEEDRGSYMCQINTDPMISQISYLEVVIPPDFIPEDTSGDLMAPEGSTVKLTCSARGHPIPSINWRRENGQNITLKSPSGIKTHVSVYEGQVLRLQKISRADMGAYLCIASNGVPPSISKRIMVSVHFHPVIHVPNQLVGAPVNTEVKLECNVEAFPRSIHFWIKDAGAMIITGDRYEVQEIAKSMFEVKMMLIIKNFRRSDAGSYHCIAKNSLGDVDSVVKLHDLKITEDTTVNGSPQRGKSYSDDEDEDYDSTEQNVGGGVGERERGGNSRNGVGTRNPQSGNGRNSYNSNNPYNSQNTNNQHSYHQQHHSSSGNPINSNNNNPNGNFGGDGGGGGVNGGGGGASREGKRNPDNPESTNIRNTNKKHSYTILKPQDNLKRNVDQYGNPEKSCAIALENFYSYNYCNNRYFTTIFMSLLLSQIRLLLFHL